MFLALHIAKGGCFPKPLSAKEEAQCFRKMREGDNDAKAKLIEHNLRLVAHITKKYYATGGDQDDLISIGTIGLIKAVTSFKSDKGSRFATYASRCIENEILMFLRKASARRAEISIDEPLRSDENGGELLLSDVLGGDADEISRELEEEEERRLVRELVAALGARERSIIELRFGLNGGRELTQKEVADRLHISQSYISRLEKRIMAQLKEKLEACL